MRDYEVNSIVWCQSIAAAAFLRVTDVLSSGILLKLT